MRRIYSIFLFVYLITGHSYAQSIIDSQSNTPTHDDTECASKVFANGLAETASAISESDSEEIIQQWIYRVFSDQNVLADILKCPEIADIADNETIKFTPIQYTFPGGREIVVNYETQPQILKQRLTIGGKRDLPLAEPNPRVGADDAVWTNVDPAWYAIMVVEHGALDNFVGPDKNNTISLDYINDNIDDLFPKNHGGTCTGKSALTRDSTEINHVMREMTVDIENDTNDYYVAGDVNLQWISYAEIALDVALTVATFGGSQVITGATKSARAARILNNMRPALKSLRQIPAVQDYIRLANQLDNANDALKNLDKVHDAAEYARRSDEIKDLTKRMSDLEKADDNVKQFKQMSNTFSKINEYRNTFRNIRGLRGAKQTGNILARGFKAFKSVNTGTKQLNKAARVARSGMNSGRVKDWLFQSTMKNIGALGRAGAATGILYGTIKFIGGMYDWTETSTGVFTNNLEFAPLLLLSADDLQGQENIVNHGMWLMWAGSSISPTDDDAAYLQAMDFATKLHQDLIEYNKFHCNIDIFVVRPIIRNPGTDGAGLYYLIMNDTPWTTAE